MLLFKDTFGALLLIAMNGFFLFLRINKCCGLCKGVFWKILSISVTLVFWRMVYSYFIVVFRVLRCTYVRQWAILHIIFIRKLFLL